MAVYSTSADQVINPGESALFDQAPVPCTRGFVRHREGSGNFLLAGTVPIARCRCQANNSARYSVYFGGNIAVNTGGTPGEISMALVLDGSTLPDTTMTVTPAAAEEFFNIGRASIVDIWRGCCETITVRNISDQPIILQAGASILLDRPDLKVSY